MVIAYDDMLIMSDDYGFTVREKPLTGSDGRTYGTRIAIRKDIPLLKQKRQVLGEEIGHALYTAGNILDMNDIRNRKQELKARCYGYDIVIGIDNLIEAYKHGCASVHDVAEYLDVTEDYLSEAINRYREKYGVAIFLHNHLIQFEPYFTVYRIDEIAEMECTNIYGI